MRKLLTLAGAAVLASSMAATAADGIYLGSSFTAYLLSSERTIDGADKSFVGSANLGYRFENNWALEAGIGTDIVGDDLDVGKIDLVYWFGGDSETWQPYFVAGFSHFDRDDKSNLQSDEDSTDQFGMGLGLSTMMDPNWEFRTDARILHKVSDGVEDGNDFALNMAINYYFNAEEPAVEPEPAPAPAPEPETRTITVRLNVEFEFDKAVVRAIYGDELQAVANAMKVHDDIQLVLEGHTDYIGTDAYNQDLSERRAAAVKARIVEDYGIDSGRISTVGYGESRPIADNATDEGRARNRRVIGEMTYTEVVTD